MMVCQMRDAQRELADAQTKFLTMKQKLKSARAEAAKWKGSRFMMLGLGFGLVEGHNAAAF